MPSYRQILKRLRKTRIQLLIIIGVLLVVVIVLVGALTFVGYLISRPDTQLRAKIKKNRIGMEFMPVPAGTFVMGSENGKSDERPTHQVTISHEFLIGRYEVTCAEWKAVMGREPNSPKGDLYPVQFVSWDEAQEFIRRLNQQNDGYSYRLPTEAEWEYACRAGSTGEYADELNFIGWYAENSDNKVHKVGYKHPNAWGLYDMEGNLSEYCQDWYGESYYAQTPGTDPPGPTSGTERVLRGGSFSDLGPLSDQYHNSKLRSATREKTAPSYILDDRGFRLVALPHP
jgi:formylglycine-generating enzyme required for sulfatase activity